MFAKVTAWSPARWLGSDTDGADLANICVVLSHLILPGDDDPDPAEVMVMRCVACRLRCAGGKGRGVHDWPIAELVIKSKNRS